MRKLISFLLLNLAVVISVFSQSGTISIEQIKEIQSSFNNDEATTAIINAVTNNKINDLTINRETFNEFDDEFKYKVSVSGITNQESSGRCWMFTSYNILRPKVMESLNISSFEFSTNYLFFWDMFEKSNFFLENIIATADKDIYDREITLLFDSPVGDGGVWSSFTNLAAKYGVIPKSVMPETYQSKNTATLNKFLNRKLREAALELRTLKSSKASDSEIEKYKLEALTDVYRILVICLGEPPTEFTWRYKDKSGNISEEKTYTPQSFYSEVVNIDLSEYIMLMDDPTREYYNLYEIENDRNVMEGKNWTYINLPASEIKPFALASIKANEAMYFSCDVAKQLNSDEGLLSVENYNYEALFGVKFDMDKKERILSRESGSTHGMALVGVDTDTDDNITKWLLENSWGATSGNAGYLTMTDEWFEEYMFRIVIKKEFIDENVLKILKKTPVILPAWDPMFLEDE